MTTTPPRLLTIAGSDSGGGAGLQADLKTFAAHGGYGFSVVTSVTAQNTRGVTAVHHLPVEIVRAQLDAVFTDIGADAVKIGMLGSSELVRTVAAGLRRHATGVPIVVDPVMVAQSGDPLIDDSAVTALAEELLPLASLVTPNLPEARRLTGFELTPTSGESERRAAARLIATMADSSAVLLKAGHLKGDTLVDVLLDREGTSHRFAHPRLDTTSTHGTGCTLASAVAARLGRGEPMVAAVGGAIDFLQQALAAAFPLGDGAGPVHHLHRLQGDSIA